MAAEPIRIMRPRLFPNRAGFDVRAVDSEGVVGKILVVRDRMGPDGYWSRDGRAVMQVGNIDVLSSFRRRRIGTKLYEAAARYACKQFKAPLASDMQRSPMSEGFWRKQYKKGRVECVGHRGRTCNVFVLSCPAPASLGRRR